jgi:hypothetical protein
LLVGCAGGCCWLRSDCGALFLQGHDNTQQPHLQAYQMPTCLHVFLLTCLSDN